VRLLPRGARAPTGAFTRQQAWALAHASDFVASTDGEMIDPWDADDVGYDRESACVRALRDEERAARTETSRLWRLTQRGDGPSDLAEQLAAAKARVNAAAAAVVRALQCPDCARRARGRVCMACA